MRDRLLVDVEAVGDEGEGDAGGFGLARRFDEKAEIDAGIGRPARVFPGIHVPARPLQHDTESHILLGHDSSFPE
ncbi:hypothetical protein D9M68_589670 [compost metagenome]